jgi:hypothetical protein
MEHIDQIFRKKRTEARSSRPCEFCKELTCTPPPSSDQMVGSAEKYRFGDF